MSVSLAQNTIRVTVSGDASPKTLLIDRPGVQVISAAIQGAPGRDGASTISTDPDNRLTTGTDNGLFSPNWSGTDPLAYYILAKA